MRRHELKYFISSMDSIEIEGLLSQFMLTDSHDSGAGYLINSIYFDTPYNNDLHEKIDGVLYREKYRIRYYESSLRNIKFEVKRKANNYIEKISDSIDNIQLDRLMSSDFTDVKFSSNNLDYVPLRMRSRLYRPVVNVGYRRRAFYLPYNNIRVTVDKSLRSNEISSKTRNKTELESAYENSANVLSEFDILEIKYVDQFPYFLSDILSSFKCVRSSASKYVHSRMINFNHPYQDGLFIPF